MVLFTTTQSFLPRLFISIYVCKCLFTSGLPVNSSPRIGIVGGGIGGSMTAYFARRLFGPDTRIDVYEKSHVGGRASLIEIEDKKYEAGASIIHDRNRYMKEMSELLKLKHRPNSHNRLGIYDGKEFVFAESHFTYMTYIDIVWRYGLSVMKWHRLIDEVLDNFEEVYQIQNDGLAYTNVEKLFHAIYPTFANMTRMTTQEFLQKRGFSDLFINELAMATTRINYGQSTNTVNALVGAASLAAAQPTVWSVQGGNYQLAEGALNLSKARLIPQKASTITLLQSGKYQITVENGESNSEYEIVIVAAPQTEDLRTLTFKDFPKPIEKNFPGKYHRTVATFVQGLVNPAYFGMKTPADTPDEIVTINSNSSYNCLSRVYPVNEKQETDVTKSSDPKIFKIFSSDVPTKEDLDDMFLERVQTKSADWLAYPQYTDLEQLGSFKLHDFLYYTSAIEKASSAMEISAVSARNAVLLAYNEFNGVDKVDKPYTSKNSLKTEL